MMRRGMHLAAWEGSRSEWKNTQEGAWEAGDVRPVPSRVAFPSALEDVHVLWPLTQRH